MSAAFPWLDEVPGRPSAPPPSGPTTSSATTELDWLRRLPAERRLRVGDDLVLVCHALARLPDRRPGGRRSTRP